MGRCPFIADQLRARQQLVQIARRQLNMDDADYRAMLLRTVGVASTKDITDPAAYDRIDAELKRLGFAHKPKNAGQPKNIDSKLMLSKIGALLADMGLPWSYADRIAENQTGGKKPDAIQRLAWVPEKQLPGIIAALQRQHVKRLKAARAELWDATAKRGMDANKAYAWASDCIKSTPDLHTADNPWLETIQTINRLRELLEEA
jgi:phage gp16-like protein